MIINFQGVKCQSVDQRVTNDGVIFLNDFIEPAKDSFSRPNVFRVTSKKQYFTAGQVCNLRAEFSAYVSRSNYTDKNTGESKVYTEMRSFLTYVDEPQAAK